MDHKTSQNIALDETPLFSPLEPDFNPAHLPMIDALLNQAQQKSAELLAVIESMPDAVYIGTETGITACNQMALQMLGFASLEAMNENAACVAERVQARIPDTGALLPPEESPFHRALQGEPCVRELLVRNLQSGEDRIVRSAAAPVVSNGKVIGAVAINTDITIQKRYQLHLDDLNKRLKRGVQETHHRVKNNLQLVSSLLDIAIMEHPEALPVVEVKRLALQIRTLAGIHDVLTHDSQYSRDANAMTLSVQVMLSRLVSMLQSTAERHRIEQEIDDLQISLQKATALALITNELVSNAIKHGRDWARVRFLVEGETARLSVEDDGPGFPADFSPETAAQTGLMLVDNLVRHDLAGVVTWENRAEGGARIVVQLPLYP